MGGGEKTNRKARTRREYSEMCVSGVMGLLACGRVSDGWACQFLHASQYLVLYFATGGNVILPNKVAVSFAGLKDDVSDAFPICPRYLRDRSCFLEQIDPYDCIGAKVLRTKEVNDKEADECRITMPRYFSCEAIPLSGSRSNVNRILAIPDERLSRRSSALKYRPICCHGTSGLIAVYYVFVHGIN